MSSVSSISSSYNTTPTSSTTKADSTAKTENVSKEESASSTHFKEPAAVFEKTKEPTTKLSQKNASIIAQLQKETEERTKQLQDIVFQSITQQGNTLASTDAIWAYLAKGNLKVSPDVQEKAKADIAEDGYWGVEKTSDRIVDFAKALANDDPSKADKMIEAFKKGFEQATKTWGKELPEISKNTYQAVLDKLDQWKKDMEANTQTPTTPAPEQTTPVDVAK